MDHQTPTLRWLALGLVLFCGMATLAPLTFAKTQTTKAKWKEIILLKKIGYTDAQLLQYIQSSKLQRSFRLKPGQVVQLLRVGISMKVIQVMGIATPSKARPTPPVKKPIIRHNPRFFLPLKLPKNRRYVHPNGHFSLVVPKGWRLFEDVHPQSAKPTLYFVPGNHNRPSKLRKGFFITQDEIPQEQRFAYQWYLAPYALMALQKKLFFTGLLQRTSKFSKGTIQSRIALHFAWTRPKIRTMPALYGRLYLLRHARTLFHIGYFSTAARSTAISPTIGKAWKTIKWLQPAKRREVKRHPQGFMVQSIIQKSRKAVVSVSIPHRVGKRTIFAAGGSGFVVTPSGYVLTNHHVVFNRKTRKLRRHFVLNWDRSTGLPSRKAVLIGAIRTYSGRTNNIRKMLDPVTGRLSARYQKQHVDLALLKITQPGTYPHVKMTGIRSALQGDMVIALGFPTEGAGLNTLGTDEMTATTGRISRLIRLADLRVNEIQHTAKVAGGNSGGPLFDASTGGVIGINTWVGIFDKRLKRPGMGLGYYYSIPIDLAWQYFSDYLDFDRQRLSHFTWYSLGKKWMANGQLGPALRAFHRARKRQSTFVPAYLQSAALYLKLAEKSKYKSHRWRMFKGTQYWANRGLRIHPNHTGLLTIHAKVAMRMGLWSNAKKYLDRALQNNPSQGHLYALRAEVFLGQKQIPQALRDANQAKRLAKRILPYGDMILGKVLYAQKKYLLGQLAFQRAFRLDPKNIDAMVHIAQGYLKQNQPRRAIAILGILAKKYKHSRKVLQALMHSYLVKNDHMRVYLTYRRLEQLSERLRQRVPASSIYWGGWALLQLEKKDKSASKRLAKNRLRWGCWLKLIWQYPESKWAAHAGLHLAKQLQDSSLRSVKDALLRLLRTTSISAKLKKAISAQIHHAKPKGLSAKGLRMLFLHPYPKTLRLAWKLFRTTPTLLDRKTAIDLLKHKIPKGYVQVMWKWSTKRQKSLKKKLKGGKGNAQDKKAIQRLAKLIDLAFNQGDVDTWMALKHPKAKHFTYERTFWNIRKKLINFQMKYTSQNQIQFQKSRGKLYAFYRIRFHYTHQRFVKAAWLFGHTQQKWQLLGLYTYK